MPPPVADTFQLNGATANLGYGIRVPGLVISPWVKHDTYFRWTNNNKHNKAGTPIALQWAAIFLQNNGPQATYNLYRTQTSGSNYQMVPSCSNAQQGGGASLAACTLKDGTAAVCCNESTVVSGQTYSYVVTSVNAKGVETPHSTEVPVIAP